jgi:hypothetical protein
MNRLLLIIPLLLLPAIGESAYAKLKTGCTKGNCLNGTGTYVFADGERYEGQWKDDQREGQGTNYWANGNRYVGQYKAGKAEGQGAYYWANGNRYVGQYKADKKEGQGTFYWEALGQRYEGQYKAGLRGGLGIQYAKNGSIRNEGLWEDDKFVRHLQAAQQTVKPKPQARPPSDTTPPTITMQRGISVISTARHTVYGQASDSSGVAVVEVGGREAALDADGNFSLDVLLKPGSNQITITATDTKFNAASKTITVNRDAAQVAQAPPSPRTAQPTIQTGQYHALIIGVEDYSHDSISDLSEPLNDARKIKRILETEYTFDGDNIRLLTNPTRGNILDELDKLSASLMETDNLLIFYAGHGYWDKRSEQGYWLPSDAQKGRTRDWIPNSTIVDFLNKVKAKHTLLVSDACFSGGIFKTRSAFNSEPDRNTQETYRLPSRTAMTSGTLTKVPDASVFVRYMTKRLEENTDRYLTSQDLFVRFKKAAVNNSPIEGLVPQWGVVQRAGDEGGDFIFVRRR